MRRLFPLPCSAILLLACCLMFPGPAQGSRSGTGAQGGHDAADAASDAAESGSEAAEAAANAAEAAKASKQAAQMAQQAGSTAGQSSTMALNTPGQGLSAARGRSPQSGVSPVERATLDAVSINPQAWNPF